MYIAIAMYIGYNYLIFDSFFPFFGDLYHCGGYEFNVDTNENY